MDQTKRDARIAGALYLLMAVTAPISLMVVPGRLFDPDSAAATADHLRHGEALLRTGIGFELFHQAVEVFLVLALYRLFQPVGRTLANQMALLGFIPIPIMFLNALNEVAALLVVQHPQIVGAFDRPQLDALAFLFMKLHGLGFQVAGVFWGLWLFPLGLLVIRSGFIPRFIGVLVIGSGIGYLVGAFAALVMPSWRDTIGDLPLWLGFGEPVLILWLLIVGARRRGAAPATVV